MVYMCPWTEVNQCGSEGRGLDTFLFVCVSVNVSVCYTLRHLHIIVNTSLNPLILVDLSVIERTELEKLELCVKIASVCWM